MHGPNGHHVVKTDHRGGADLNLEQLFDADGAAFSRPVGAGRHILSPKRQPGLAECFFIALQPVLGDASGPAVAEVGNARMAQLKQMVG